MTDKVADTGMGNWQPGQSSSNFGLTKSDPASQGGAPGARPVRIRNGVPQVDPYPDGANDGLKPIIPEGDVSDIMTSDEIVGLDATRPADNRGLLIVNPKRIPREKETVPRAITMVSFVDVVRDVSPSGQTAPAPIEQGQRNKKIDPWVDLGDNGITVNLNLNDPKIKKMIQHLQMTFPEIGFFPGVRDINKVGQDDKEELKPLREPTDLDKHLVLNHGVDVNTTVYEIALLEQLHQQMHAQGESSDHNPEVLRVANILDPIQETLDSKVWDSPESETPRFKSSLNSWVKQAIFGTLKNAGYKNPENWIKLIVTGSLTTYQWSEESDLDVSIWVDLNEFKDFDRSEMIKLIIDNLDGDLVPGTLHPIQCFVVDVNEIKSPNEIYKTGVRSAYSLDTNEWIVKPERNRSANVRSQFPDFFRKARQASAKMQLLLKYQPQSVKTYWHFLHKRRRDDMKAGMGDYSESNIVYKMLANDGLFDDIERITNEHIAKITTRDEETGKYFYNTELGAYPISYFTEDGGILCPSCANGENDSEASEGHENPEWNLIDSDVIWESDDIPNCDNCYEPIFPAYLTEEQEKQEKKYNKEKAERHHDLGDHNFCGYSCKNLKIWLDFIKSIGETQ